MSIKKRTTLRAKSEKKVAGSKLVEKKSAASNQSLNKQKLLEKLAARRSTTINTTTTSATITSKSQLFDPNQPGISKSAVRRRKRKQREQLKPKLDDLLDVLEKSVPTTSAISDEDLTEYQAKPKLDHTPNPHSNLRSKKIVEAAETKRFGAILKDPSFKANPFGALKDAILKNNERL